MENFVKNILVPTDYSLVADNAVKYAFEFAKSQNYKIHLLHVVHLSTVIDPNIGYFGNSTDYFNEAQEKVKIEQYKNEFCKQYPDVEVESKVKLGFLFDVVKQEVFSKKIDLIILGTKGASGIQEFLLGSNAGTIVENINIPTLVIPEHAKFTPLKNILYASDFQINDIENIQKIAVWAAKFDSKITIIHVADKEINENNLQAWFKELVIEKTKYKHIEVKYLSYQSDLLNQINTYIDLHNIDFVVMNARQKTFLKKFFSGSLTLKMAYHTHIPFLAFHVS